MNRRIIFASLTVRWYLVRVGVLLLLSTDRTESQITLFKLQLELPLHSAYRPLQYPFPLSYRFIRVGEEASDTFL